MKSIDSFPLETTSSAMECSSAEEDGSGQGLNVFHLPQQQKQKKGRKKPLAQRSCLFCLFREFIKPKEVRMEVNTMGHETLNQICKVGSVWKIEHFGKGR